MENNRQKWKILINFHPDYDRVICLCVCLCTNYLKKYLTNKNNKYFVLRYNVCNMFHFGPFTLWLACFISAHALRI